MNASTIVIGEKYGWYFEGFNATTRMKPLHFQSGKWSKWKMVPTLVNLVFNTIFGFK
jgi:hypothetical protein